MDPMETILTRRSVRRFEDKPVSEELIEKLLAAGMAAPTARDAREWQFVVIDDREMLAQVGEINPNAKMAQKAPVAILVCGDLSLEKSEGYWVVDCAAMVENILLAAHSLGLGAVWTGVYPRPERVEGLKQLVGLPDHVMAHSLIVIGHPAEHPAPRNLYDPDRVRRNRW